LQVGEYREHPPVIVGGRQQLELREDGGDVGLERLPGHRQPISDCLVRSPFRHQGQAFAFPLGQVAQSHAILRAERRQPVGRRDDVVGAGHRSSDRS
jgi:hypothetical protein